MKTILVLMAIAVGCSFSIAQKKAEEANGLSWKAFEAGFAEAQKSERKIMIDVYTDWCTWCKRLDRDTYSNDQVARYLNNKYVIIKLNAESNSKVTFEGTSYTEATLAAAFGVSGYPTIIFFDEEGKPLDKVASYLPAEQFLPILKYFGENAYKTMSWNEFRQQNSPPAAPKKSRKN